MDEWQNTAHGERLCPVTLKRVCLWWCFKLPEMAQQLPTALLEVQGHIDPPPESALKFEVIKENVTDVAPVAAPVSPFDQPTTPYIPAKTANAASGIADVGGKIPLGSPESFISCRVCCLMEEPYNRSRPDALRQAYQDCVDNGYRLYASDPGYRHSLMAKILSAPARLLAFLGDTISLAGGKATTINDGCVSVPFECVKGGHVVPRAGTFRITDGSSGNLCLGRYALPDNCELDKWYQMRVPIQACTRIRRNCVVSNLPMQNLYLRCMGMPDGKMCVSDMRLKAYLAPRADMLLDPNTCVRRCFSDRACPFEHEPRPTTATDSSDASDPNQNLEATKASVNDFVSSFLPSMHKWRCYGHIGRTNIVNCGNDAPGKLYRIGGVTETITMIAVQNRVRDRDLHSPDVTAELLNESGAVDVLIGLKACFEGTNIPTIHQLMNHCSSLPEASTLTLDHLRRMLHQGDSRVEELSGAGRQLLLGQLLRDTRPFARHPGVMHRHSHLNTLILRHMLPDWRTDDCTELRRTCADLGMPSADMCTRVTNHAECVKGSTTLEGELASNPQWINHFSSHCNGLSVRTSELAAFLSGASHNCKHSWQDDGSASQEYAFVPAMERAAVPCHLKTGTAYGWGWHHGSVLTDVPAFGRHGLRVMMRYGETQCGHTTVACRVPGTRLSFVFNTTAPLNALCKFGKPCVEDGPFRPASLLGTIGGMVRAILAPMFGAPSLHNERARFWDRTHNTALCEMPPQCSNYASHFRYCSGKYPYFAAPVASMRPFVDAGELVSIVDGGDAPGGYSLTLREIVMEPSKRAVAVGDSRRLVRYELVCKTAMNERIAHQLVYDPDGFVDNDVARSYSGSKTRSGRPGCYRILCPNTGLLTESVGFYRTRFPGFNDEPCVSFGGRIYFKRPMYSALRREFSPSPQELLDDSFALTRSLKESGAPIGAADAETHGIGALASAIHNAKPAEAEVTRLPEPQTVANRRGWGRRRGGGAFAAGVALGAIGAATAYPYGYYPPAYPAYPRIVGYDVYGRPIYG